MIDSFRKLMDILDARERRNFWLLMGMLLVMGLTNMVGIASILPFLAVLADPTVVETNPYLSQVYVFSGAESPMTFLLMLGVLVVLLYLCAVAFKAAASLLLLRYSIMRSHSLSQRMLGNYLSRSYPWFLQRHSSDLTRNVLGEVQQVVQGSLLPMLNGLSNAAVVVFLLALLLAVNPMIALSVAVLLGGSYAVIFAFVRRRLLALGEMRLLANRRRFRAVQEGFHGVKEIKVLSLEQSLMRRYSQPSRKLASVSSTTAIINDLPRHALEALAFGGMMAVVLALAWVNEGNLGQVLPVAGVYALAGSRIAPAMQVVYRNVAQLRFGKATLDAVHEELTSAPSFTPPPPPTESIRLRQSLQLEAADFSYPGSERGALHGLDLDIAANSTIGVVGGTGAGKTTAIDVIMGLLAPQAGRLVVDGREIGDEESRRAWRRAIGYVPQQIYLVDDSVSANIAFGMPEDEIDHAAVERASRMAELHDFVIEELPDGYATRIGDRGVRLSGGQRQRVGIARALYHDPDMLVLDEATSALDNITERTVIEAVSHLGGAKTIIMIAHRLTTVMGCDRIYLLERGRVAASGTYAELLESSPAFRDMAMTVSQSQEAEKAAKTGVSDGQGARRTSG